MSRGAQAWGGGFLSGLRRGAVRLALPAVAALLLGACSSGFGLGEAEVDRSIYTSSVTSGTGGVENPERLSDEMTVRNAVSSADLEGAGTASLRWANADTGSRGAISALSEYRNGGMPCRRFLTTRESFDGISLYRGEACMAGPGLWKMTRFDAI